MRGKLIFITGVGVGYVLGTRAGREKFDQMVAQARKVWESPTVQEAAGVVQAQATKLYDEGKQAVTDQVHKLSHARTVPALDDDEAWRHGASQFSASASWIARATTRRNCLLTAQRQPRQRTALLAQDPVHPAPGDGQPDRGQAPPGRRRGPAVDQPSRPVVRPRTSSTAVVERRELDDDAQHRRVRLDRRERAGEQEHRELDHDEVVEVLPGPHQGRDRHARRAEGEPDQQRRRAAPASAQPTVVRSSATMSARNATEYSEPRISAQPSSPSAISNGRSGVATIAS